jgi:hypothetical protein
MACGAVPVTVPLDGMPSLFGDFSPRLIAGEASPGSLAQRVDELLREDLAPLQRLLLQRSDQFAFPRAADRLMQAYAEIL